MIPDSKRRLNVAYKELTDLIELMIVCTILFYIFYTNIKNYIKS